MEVKNIGPAILGAALAFCAVYLEVNDKDTGILWLGVVICFLST